jgi:hypothetical protein
MQKRVFSVGSFFDTFLAVQKSIPNAYDIDIPYTTTKARPTENCPSRNHFHKSSNAKWPPLPLKKRMCKSEFFPLGVFFDTFLAVQKSMPNAYDIAIHKSSSIHYPTPQQRPKPTENCPSRNLFF